MESKAYSSLLADCIIDTVRFIINLSSQASDTGDKEWLEEIQVPSGMLGWKDKLEILDQLKTKIGTKR